MDDGLKERELVALMLRNTETESVECRKLYFVERPMKVFWLPEGWSGHQAEWENLYDVDVWGDAGGRWREGEAVGVQQAGIHHLF